LSCKNYDRNSSHKNVPLSSIKKGEILAIKYCQSCHLLPDPSLLDTKSWEKGVLPNMGPRLGIFHYGFETYPSFRRDKDLDPNFYPSQPLLNFEDWQNIIDYYVATSPDSLPKQNRKQSIHLGLPHFSVQRPQLDYENPTTSFVKIRATELYSLIISDVFKQKFYFFNNQLEIKDSVSSNGPIVDVDFSQNQMLACNIGILNPNNGKFGKGQLININSDGKMVEDTSSLFDKLRRPVQITAADLNNDGKKDYLVCEFGNLTGGLSWMENLGNDKFKKHILREAPGAIKAYINDYNHDGRLDLWVLFAQGDEGIYLFTNKGNGNFETKAILRFPSVYGSSYFEFADFNKDGYPDIVYTCGDNADYSPVLKPYHGVYIFLNDKTNHFKQKYFFPINGCYKAIARDYDGDGDLDIATISFFPDPHQPEEGFVYLENAGNFNFTAYSFPEARWGRWLTMDAGDIDGDGKIDLVLGNFSIGARSISNSEQKQAPPFLVLRNTINK
jgi:FG-GAP-like repeat